jgi:hypothetical protein
MQIQPPASFAASFELSGLPVLVCGGGSAALSVIRRLLDSGAVVTVVAPEIGATVADLAGRGLLTMATPTTGSGRLSGVALVVPATGANERDQAIAAAARDHGVPAVSPAPATIETPTGTGTVILVGGGPGDLGLLTVAGLEAVKDADVIVCDRLAPLGRIAARPARGVDHRSSQDPAWCLDISAANQRDPSRARLGRQDGSPPQGR